jgi:sugar/nucleoside kinase (ribokinase family)
MNPSGNESIDEPSPSFFCTLINNYNRERKQKPKLPKELRLEYEIICGWQREYRSQRLINESKNVEENRIKEMMFTIGGSAANTAIMLSRLRKNVFLQGAVGTDRFGDMAIEALTREGVDIRYLARIEGKTGFCFSAVSTDGQKTLFTYRGVNEVDYPVDVSSDFYHFWGIAPRSSYQSLEGDP